MDGVFEEVVFTVCEIPVDLLHPGGIRARRDPRDVDTSGFQLHHSKDVERREFFPSPDFGGREIRREDRFPVSFQKRRPRRCLLATWCGFDAMVFEDISHCGVSGVVAEISEGSLNSVVAPRGILCGESSNRVHVFLTDARPPWATLLTGVELFRRQFTVSTKDRAGSHNGGQFMQGLATRCVAFDTQ